MAVTSTAGAPNTPLDLSVRNARLSFIWNETHLDLLLGNDKNGPLASFGSEVSFARTFESVARGESPVNQFSFTLPWKVGSPEFFWSYYVSERERSTRGLPGDAAWRLHIPLRLAIDPSSEFNLTTKRFSWWAEALFYPHGITLVITFRLKSRRAILDLAQDAVALRRERLFAVGETGKKDGLPLVAEALFKKLRTLAGLGQPVRHTGSQAPFSIFTIVRADGSPPIEIESARRPLHAITSWSRSWANDRLPDLKDALIEVPDKRDELDIYRGERSRAVWHPDIFTLNLRNLHTLSCFHHNLTLLSAQVESLGNFLIATADAYRPVPPAKSELRASARNALQILDALDLRQHTIYKSRSTEHQIREHRDLAESVSFLRPHLRVQKPTGS